MANQFNNLPTYQTQLIDGERTGKDWFFFFVGLFKGLAPENESAVTLTGSPYTYTAPRGGFVIVSGGTVSLIEYSRSGTTYYNAGATSGTFPLSSQDRLRITYTVLPTVTFVPT